MEIASLLILSSIFSGAGSTALMKDVVGSWKCGPYAMKGPDFSISVVDYPSYDSSGSFSELSVSTISMENGSSATTKTTSSGSWRLSGKIIEVTFKSIKFLSSDNPKYTIKMGQSDADALLHEKDWSRKEVLEHGARLVTRPVDAQHEEAVVTVSCVRIEPSSSESTSGRVSR